MNRTNYAVLLTFFLVLSTTLHGQWIPLNVGQGVMLSTVTTANAIYTVSQTNGVYKSVDDGSTWNAANSGLPSGGTNMVKSVGAAGTYVLAGTTSGVYRSGDAGASWSNINGSLSFSSTVYAHKWSTFGNTTLAVYTGTIANGGGIARTTNNGNTWLLGHSGMSSNLTVNNITSNGTTLFAATTIGLFRSDDNASSWTAVPTTNFNLHAVEWIDGRLVAIVANSTYRYSTDQGGSWTVATGSPTSAPKGELRVFEGKIYAITGTPSGCMWSADNGSTWGSNNVGLAGFDMYSQHQFHMAGDRLYMGAASDLYRIQGTSTSVGEMAVRTMPTPYPTVFQECFHVDLDALPTGGRLIVMDMMGRVVFSQQAHQGGVTTVPRGTLAQGRYECQWLDPRSGQQHRLGAVIAE